MRDGLELRHAGGPVGINWTGASVIPDPLLTELEKVLSDAPEASIPALLGNLERLKMVLWAKLMHMAVPQAQPALGEETLLSIPQVAERLKIPVARCYELARYQGGLPTIRLGKSLRVSPSELTAWLARPPKKGLDNGLCQRHSGHHDPQRTAKTTNRSQRDASRVSGPHRRPLEHRGPMGARRPTHPGTSGASDSLRGASASEAKG